MQLFVASLVLSMHNTKNPASFERLEIIGNWLSILAPQLFYIAPCSNSSKAAPLRLTSAPGPYLPPALVPSERFPINSSIISPAAAPPAVSTTTYPPSLRRHSIYF